MVVLAGRRLPEHAIEARGRHALEARRDREGRSALDSDRGMGLAARGGEGEAERLRPRAAVLGLAERALRPPVGRQGLGGARAPNRTHQAERPERDQPRRQKGSCHEVNGAHRVGPDEVHGARRGGPDVHAVLWRGRRVHSSSRGGRVDRGRGPLGTGGVDRGDRKNHLRVRLRPADPDGEGGVSRRDAGGDREPQASCGRRSRHDRHHRSQHYSSTDNEKYAMHGSQARDASLLLLASQRGVGRDRSFGRTWHLF